MKRSEAFCGCMTVRDAIAKLEEAAKSLPSGLDSPLTLGDYEGNYMQGPSVSVEADQGLGCVFVGYEMHENIEDDIPYDDEGNPEFDPE